MTYAAIVAHAEKYLSSKGRYVIRDSAKKTPGFCESEVIVTTPTTVEHYTIFADHCSIGMTHSKTEPLPELPLFGGLT